MKKRLAALLLAMCLLGSWLGAFASAEPESTRLPIVMYHHISRNAGKWNAYVVSLSEFTADLDYLAAHGWHSITVRNLLDWYEGRFTMPEKPFLLTFDDGFESTLSYAEPLLESHGFTGVVAVIGSVCEKFTRVDEHDAELSNMSWADASAMARRGVIEVQCHTWDMHALSPRRGCSRMEGESLELYRLRVSRDLSRFLQGCEENGLDIVPTIAYPYGAYSAATTELVRDMGFLAAFTCDEHINQLSGDREELYHLARFNRPHGVSSEKFFSLWEENT